MGLRQKACHTLRVSAGIPGTCDRPQRIASRGPLREIRWSRTTGEIRLEIATIRRIGSIGRLT